MKKFYLLSAMLLAAIPVFNSCSSDTDDPFIDGIKNVTTTPKAADTALFPTDDGAKKLSSDPATALKQILAKTDANRATVMGETPITDEQFAEIKEFVDNNLKGQTDETTYRKIFNWIVSNVRYVSSPDETGWLDPYDVFIHKRCVCQGYANLLKTMCLTQGIPACCVNGMLQTIGAHAWNYVYVNKKWIVSDPTNNMEFSIANTSGYKNVLIPLRIDFDLFEDDKFTYSFYDGGLNVSSVKEGVGETVTIPFSAEGYQVSTFAPQETLPANVKTIYLGKNIISLGLDINLLPQYTPNLEEVYVDEANPTFSSENFIVYYKGSVYPLYIPTGIRRVVFKEMKTLEKNTLYNLPRLEEIVVAEGTESIEDYAVENCPNLLRIYIPEDLPDENIAKDAFYRCGDRYQILRVPTGIHHVTM